MSQIGQGVTLNGVDHPDFAYTYNLSVSTTKAHLGLAMAVDTAANNQMKPAGDGEAIRGVLFSFEDRKTEGVKVGAVRSKGGFKLPKAAGAVVNRGDSIVGGGAGTVKAAATPSNQNFVVEVDATHVVVVFA